MLHLCYLKRSSRFAVEMQAQRDYTIIRRSRYYHSVMDMDELLSTEGSADDISSDLLAFLHYVKSSTDETASRLNNDLVYKIHNRVTYIRQNRQMEVEYLKFEELMRESRWFF